MGKSKILLVDDESVNLEILEEILEDDFDLSFAENGKIAMESLSHDQPDLILLDVMMPEMTGWEVLKKVKKDPLLKLIPVIMQTALTSREDFQRGLSLGAYYYVSKPIKLETLVPLIKAALREYKQLNELKENLKKTDITLSLIEEWKLRFRTREHAILIAKLVAKACPSPERNLIGLLEILLNAVEHGIAGIGYQSKSELMRQDRFSDEVKKRLNQEALKDKFAHLYYQKTDDYISIQVEDPGPGFDWQNYLNFNLNRATDTHGRGIAMAKTFSFDSLDYSEQGNCVTAKMKIVQ
ncbi:MAG: response regulator [Deltaproteobacteria bacterium]|jgi:CheY-like chemotaxis protein|nr:response regulator [Deltaproteobacteria bacterium]MBT4525750.1 response regulator [Deltaproteobacteria bacterium]